MSKSSLDIVVIGAGLGGLGTAYALRAKGHKVTIYEATKRLMTAGAGIQIPPISTRILKSWGLEEELSSVITVPGEFTYRNYRTGEVLGRTPLNPLCEELYGSPWWTIHRADYQGILYNACIRAGVEVHLDCPMISIDCENGSIRFTERGIVKSHTADLVVGADGLRSLTRAAILGDRNPELTLATPSACAYRALVPLESMNRKELLAPLMDPKNPNVDVWLGPGHMILAYPVRRNDDAVYNMVLVHPEKDDHTHHDLPPRFPRPASIPEVADHYSDFCLQVSEFIKIVTPEGESDYFIKKLGLNQKDGILEWRMSDLPALQTWRSQSNKVLLVGDSAHAAFPYHSAGAALAIEDGVALAECLTAKNLQQHSLEDLLKIYEEIRLPRTTKMTQYSRNDERCWHLEDGPWQKRRDELLKTLDNLDRKIGAKAMEALREETNGRYQFNFGDPAFMDFAWGYDVVQHVNERLQILGEESARRSEVR